MTREGVIDVHRHLRSLHQASESELVKADGISLEELCFIITELQERAKMASEEAVTIKKDSTEPHSRKRTREEAAMELEVVEIDAKIFELQQNMKRRDIELRTRESSLKDHEATLNDKNLAIEERRFFLELAKEGSETAISCLMEIARRGQ